MTIALSEFWTRLVRAELADTAGCKRLAASFSKANQGTPPSDPSTLAKFMVASGELTEFQASALLSDPPIPIRLGHFLVRSSPCRPPLSQWAEVTRVSDGETGILFRATPSHVAGGREQWLAAHAEIRHPALQSFQLEVDAAATMVFSPLPAGQMLGDILGDSGLMSPQETCRIGILVADALAALHKRPLIHGSVRPDRIWVVGPGKSILMRDPSGPPVIPTEAGGDQPTWIDAVDKPQAYAAPELAISGQAPNQTTDVYALGCLLFRLVTGRDPFRGGSIQETLSAHATETPAELAAAIEQGEAGDPLFRVIAFAMAKNPAARFATASQLSGALQATLPLLAQVEETIQPPPTPAVPDSSAAAKSKSRVGQTGVTTQSQKGPAEKKSTSKEKQKRSIDPTEERQKTESKPRAKKRPASASSAESKERSVSRKSAAVPSQASNASAATPGAAKSGSAKPPTPRKSAKSKPETSAAPAPSPSPIPKFPSVEQTPPADSHPNAFASAPEHVGAKETGEGHPSVAEASQSIDPKSVVSAQPVGTETNPSTPRPRRRRKKKKSSAPLILGGMCVLVLMLVIGLIVHDPSVVEAKKKSRPPIPDVIPPVSNRPVVANAIDTEPTEEIDSVDGYELVDDRRLLFVPPFAAESPDAPLQMLPPGPSMIVSVRLARIAESGLGSEIIESLSPELASLISYASDRSAVPVESIARCTMALHPGSEGWPEVSLAIELTQPQPSGPLTQAWKVAASRTPDGATIYAGDDADGDAFYFQSSEEDGDLVSRFAIGSIAQMSEVAAAEGGAALLPRNLQSLWSSTSDEADLVLLVTPNFLFADGRSLLQSTAPELVKPLKSALIPDVSGALVIAHVLDDQLFVETRLAPSGGISEAGLMGRIREAIEAWPTWADEFIVNSVPDPSWRLLASRLPSMMRFVVDQTRFGVSEGAVIANMYLPDRAVPQVALATLLAMNTRGGQLQAVAGVSEELLSLEEMLARKMSVSFDQESLEFAIDAIVGDFQRVLPAGSKLPPVKIIGSDLQKMGITQNQQVRDFTKTDLPLRTVLTDLVLGANPDKSATGPKDERQSLIWVVADDPSNSGHKAILVTTRQAAEGKYELPAEFRSEPN